MITILGIDPGSRITGYGVIRSNGFKHQHIACGVINVKGETLVERLQDIFHHMQGVLQTYNPSEAAIEEVFMRNNPMSAIKLGQARGAAIVAFGTQIIPVAEYSARQIKKAVVGYGAAQKTQIQQMVSRLLNLSEMPSTDAADALAIAICHAHMRGGIKQLAGQQKVARGRIT